MPLYTVLTRILGREPQSEDLPGAIIDMPEDEAARLVEMGALEPAPDDAVADDTGGEGAGGEGAGGGDPILIALDALTVKQLNAVATAVQFDLGTASKKADIIAALAATVDRGDADQVAAFIVITETAKAG